MQELILEEKTTLSPVMKEINPDFIATEGKFKGCIFYQTDTDSNRVDVFDPSGNIMADFSIFQNEAIRNYEKTRLGIQGAVEHN